MSLNSSLIAGGGNKNEHMDFYPTPPDVTEALLQYIPFSGHVWEPACGTGEMSEVLKSKGLSVFSTDVRETGYAEKVGDFLKAKHACDAIITNPPFGIAEDFIRHALTQTPTVAMLLKAHYWNAKCRYQLFQEHPPAYVLGLTWRPNFYKGAGNHRLWIFSGLCGWMGRAIPNIGCLQIRL